MSNQISRRNALALALLPLAPTPPTILTKTAAVGATVLPEIVEYRHAKYPLTYIRIIHTVGLETGRTPA